VSDTGGLEFRAPFSAGAGLDGLERGFGYGDRHDSPVAPPEGLTSWDLAEWVGDFSTYATTRVLGIGAHQYDLAGRQKFEGLDIQDICDELIDELADVVNYAAMLALKVTRVRDEVDEWARRPF